jgi:hypothetical protein
MKIPKTQSLLEDSQQCPTSVARRGLVEGKLAVLAQLEAVLVDSLQLPS